LREQLLLLPGYLAAHVRLVVVALGVCFALCVPLGILATRQKRVERYVVGLASVIQTIPALALLAAMVPLLGAIGAPAIGALPALIALTVYAALPILLATITGIREVNPAVIEAARAVGMTERQRLWLVEMPLSLPFVVAGTRTAAVWSVGMATLSTPIGAKSLGNFIFGGLQTRNHAAILVGCVSAALLALVLDALVRLVEHGLRQRHRLALRGGLAGLFAFAAFTLVTALAAAFGGPRPLRIGAKPFTESVLLAHVLAARAEAAGAHAEVLDSLGSSVLFDALASGDLDAYVDYSGTLHTTVLHRSDAVDDRAALIRSLKSELEQRSHVLVAAALGFENTYCLALRAADARANGWHDISELAARTPSLSIGGDYEFFGREEWRSLRRVYGLAFREERTMDPTLMYQAVREHQVDVISAYSTDGRIAAYELTVLEDDRHVIPPYDALVLVRGALAEQAPGVLDAFRALEQRIDAGTMRELNRQVDELGRTPREVAHEFSALMQKP
jgi:osmoprotectant transport system substrate-binding protein/osmoprotectant transport system permease protein